MTSFSLSLSLSLSLSQIPAFMFPPAIPKLGPLSGGTRVTIMGHNFGIGNNRSIILAGGHCDIVNKEDITLVF